MVEATRPDWVIGGHLHMRHSGALTTSAGKAVSVEVLDKVEAGIATTLFIADLRDGVRWRIADSTRCALAR